MNTLLLDVSAWDLVKDAAGNIALAGEPYAQSQDVASQLRLFLSELWYDVLQGVAYFADVLGHAPPLTYFQELMTREAVRVPGVAAAQCTITVFENRVVNGQVTFTLANGQTGTVNLQ